MTTATATNGVMHNLKTVVQTNIDNGTAPSVEPNNEPRHKFGADAGLTPEIAAALLADNPGTMLQTLDYVSTRKNQRTVKVVLAVGQADGWTPVRNLEASHVIARGKATHFDKMLADAAAVRGGTILAVSIGYKSDALGFRVYDPNPVRKGLDDAFMRLPADVRQRVDTDYRILANDQQADDFADIAGYFLVKIKGYRVK